MPVYDAKGHLIALEGIARDITERKRAEDALQESEQKYRTLAESIPSMVHQFILYPDGSIAVPYVNEHILEYAGISAAAVMADPSMFFVPVHPDEQEMVEQAISFSAHTLKNFCVEHRLIDTHGDIRWFHGQSIPQKLSDGAILWNGV